MAAATSASTMSLLQISQLKQQQRHDADVVVVFRRRPRDRRRRRYVVPTARLFGPATFEASKLKVFFLGVDEESGGKQGKPPLLPRTYPLTHSDVTASLTLVVSHTINRVVGDFDSTWRFIDSFKIPYHAPSFGGCESIIDQSAIMSYWDPKEERDIYGIRIT